MKRYEECKDSGVQWIGDVPNHWEIRRLKTDNFLKGRIGWNGLRSEEFKEDSYAYLVTGQDFVGPEVEWSKCYQIDKDRYDEDPFIQLQNGNLLITKDGTIGKIAKVNNLDKPACLNSGIFVMKQKTQRVYDQGYIYWLLCSNLLKEFNNYTSNGTTILHLYQNVFERMPMLLPTFSEQQSIASFLDAKTKPIDNIISKREKQIELLEEVKSTIIRRAVTKGLNPNAKMKDSGIEWIGEIPEGWEAADLKRYAKISTGKTPSTKYDEYFENEEVVWFTPGDFPDNGILLKDSSRKIDKRAIEANEAFLYPERSVFLVGIGGTLGKVGIFKDKASCNQQINIIICKANVCKKFVAYYLYSKKEILKVFSNAATLPILNQEKTGYIKIVMPPMEEQQAVASYLDSETSKLAARIAKRHKQIELLQEYKQALITDAVTGKIDVRENSCQ